MKDINALGTEKVSKLLIKYSVPAIIAMIVNAIYNVVDRMFIGHFVGDEALAGLAITYPLNTILFSFSMLIGTGCSNILSNRLGSKDIDGASKVFGSGMTYGVILTFILCIISYVFRFPILSSLGGTPDILPFAEQYLNITLLGFVFLMISFILTNTIRSEGKVIITMTSMIAACITNIILDYIFIVPLQMGVKGAAIATILGQLVGLLILASFYFRKHSALHLHKSNFKFNLDLVNQINKIGFASFFINAGAAITLIIMNKELLKYGGIDAISAMTIAFSIQSLVFMPIFGLRQGVQAIMGYNYGAKNIHRVYEALFLGMKVAGAYSIVSFIIIMLFPQNLALLFLKSDTQILDLTTKALRLFLLTLPIFFIHVFGVTLFQATSKGNLANFVTLVKQLLIIPFVLVLPIFFGLDGVFYASPVSDLISITLVIYFIIKEYKYDKKMYGKV